MKRKTRTLAFGVALLLAGAGLGTPDPAKAATCPLPHYGRGASYRPAIDPSRFGPDVTNPFFPLSPGTTFVYVGVKDGKRALDVVVPSARTRVIDGVTTRIVADRLYVDAKLVERTSDYYAQDDCGNVWYFGEDTAELNAHGKVTSREGSFHAGVGGAQPGVMMTATLERNRKFRQEWSAGQAEDAFRAIDVSATTLRTEEWTALEPGTRDNKFYKRGVGETKEVAVKGPTERLSLVEVLK